MYIYYYALNLAYLGLGVCNLPLQLLTGGAFTRSFRQ